MEKSVIFQTIKFYQNHAGCEEFCKEVSLANTFRIAMCGHTSRDAALTYIMDTKFGEFLDVSVDFLPKVGALLNLGDGSSSNLRKYIVFALSGLNDKVAADIWDFYVHKKEPISSIAVQVGYSKSQVRRILDVLPSRMANFLFRKEVELGLVINSRGEEKGDVLTSYDHLTRREFLRQFFDLSPAEIDLFEAYTKDKERNRGQSVISEELHKSISTLKSQKRSIIRKVRLKDSANVDNFNETIVLIFSYFKKYGL